MTTLIRELNGKAIEPGYYWVQPIDFDPETSRRQIVAVEVGNNLGSITRMYGPKARDELFYRGIGWGDWRAIPDCDDAPLIFLERIEPPKLVSDRA